VNGYEELVLARENRMNISPKNHPKMKSPLCLRARIIRCLRLVPVLLIGSFAVAQDGGNSGPIHSTFPDPAVPMIQLPTEFRTQRTNTEAALKKGESVDILNVKGPGAVRSIWQLFAQNLEIEVTVDGAEQPQVRIPANPFYGIMHDLKPYFINSAGIVTLPNPAPGMPGNPGYNCYMPIPFSKSCRIRIHATDNQTVTTMVNWHQYREGTPLTPFRFHAAYNLKKPAVPRDDFSMLETEGRGFVAGLFMGAIQKDHSNMVFHTGGMRILIDGETEPHAIRGHNMEDDYGFTWGFNDRQTPWIGCPWHQNRGFKDQDGVFYRFFGPDPIAFHSSISFSTGCRADDTESVLYYYRVLGSKAPEVATPPRWQFTDPFSGSNTWEGFNRQEFVENTPAGDWPDVVKLGEQSVRVHSVDSKYTWLSLNRYFRELKNHAVYARTTIESEVEGEAVLRIALDDWAIVWLNGEKVATLRHENGLESVRIPVQLKRGKNELRIKTTNTNSNNRGLWAISCVWQKKETR
jgi:hypothetical protein